MNTNITIMTGRVIHPKDGSPAMKTYQTKTGKTFGKFSLSVQTGNEKGADGYYPSDIWTVYIWEKLCENFSQIIDRAKMVTVVGAITKPGKEEETWTDQNGNVHASEYKFTANRPVDVVSYIDNPAQASTNPYQGQAPQVSNPYQGQAPSPYQGQAPVQNGGTPVQGQAPVQNGGTPVQGQAAPPQGNGWSQPSDPNEKLPWE